MNKLEAICFDFDGVLVESVDIKTKAFIALYEQHGAAIVEKVVEHHKKFGGVSRVEKIRHCHRHFLNTELSDAEVEQWSAKFSDLVEAEVARAEYVPGAVGVLDKYFKKIPLFVVSGTPEGELRRIVKKRGMEKYFKGVFGSPASKAEILQGILQRERLQSENTLMVGDALTDFEGAKANAMQFIGRVEKGFSPFPVNVKTITNLTELLG